MATAKDMFERRKQRIRFRLRALTSERPRLSVFRSNKHIYAQIIDDRAGRTLASASSVEETARAMSDVKGADMAEHVGKRVAERALALGVKAVVFDRGGYRYHGRVKALADSARDAGLSF